MPYSVAQNREHLNPNPHTLEQVQLLNSDYRPVAQCDDPASFLATCQYPGCNYESDGYVPSQSSCLHTLDAEKLEQEPAETRHVHPEVGTPRCRGRVRGTPPPSWPRASTRAATTSRTGTYPHWTQQRRGMCREGGREREIDSPRASNHV